MRLPLVTVFIPVFNCEKYICECLDSIVNQTYKNLDILIIDDGSTDKTVQIIESYKDKRIRLIKNNKNKGIPYTRNLGIKESRGKYIALMDADDISNNNRIEKQVNFLESNLNVDVVTSNYRMFNDKISKKVILNKNIEEIKISLIFLCSLCNPSSMIRVDSMKNLNINYNKNCFIAQDYELWTQFARKGNIFNLEDVLLNYRTDHGNITSKTKANKRIERRRIIDSIHNDMLDYYGFNLDRREKEIFNNFFDDNPINKLNDEEIKNIILLIDKMIKINKEKSIFTPENFVKEVNFAVINRIAAQPMRLKNKIKLYNNMVIDKSKIDKFKDLNKIILKHLYINIKL